MHTIAIVGASGYIGSFLVAELLRMGDCRVRVLSRNGRLTAPSNTVGWSEVEVVQGDLMVQSSLNSFLDPACTVINLAYLWECNEFENLKIVANLNSACKAAKVKRIIHCSTAAVIGRTPDDVVTECTPCRPVTEYGRTKLRMEELVVAAAAGNYDAVILRPTSVFGPGGNPLKKLANDILHGRHLQNYLKSCLFGKRRMNLVHVDNVVAAIIFFIHREGALGGEIFNVSDDDDSLNNFIDIEDLLMREFGVSDYFAPRLILPMFLLSILLRGLGRNMVNPRCNFSPDKLLKLGFSRPISLEAGLQGYAAWYRSSFLSDRIPGQP